jgi:hypothetical protein
MAPEVTPLGAVRRIRALAARGWSPRTLAAATGLEEAVFTRQPAELAAWKNPPLQEIGDAYERLWNAQPPRSTSAERHLAKAAAERARQRGWPPPMAWDDDLLDDPSGGPALGWKPRETSRTRRADLLEDIAFLREVDGAYLRATPAQLAVRLGVSKGSVEQALARDQAERRGAGRELEAG